MCVLDMSENLRQLCYSNKILHMRMKILNKFIWSKSILHYYHKSTPIFYLRHGLGTDSHTFISTRTCIRTNSDYMDMLWLLFHRLLLLKLMQKCSFLCTIFASLVSDLSYRWIESRMIFHD